ncbi:uncharacterized protein [Physcomitrium patens]|uniref:TRAF-type domain-containing protein n=1 Tax=Physcomitrium patens TaxID=3218 RepID=A0A2K1IFQ7_PHYPA|nr:uncharacterized protein LOC112276347 isoform X2 [Physcomitrium patens]PNR28110.1 hypothetical protein PHYPA_028702 [Physcomitrium patens]|eukprot:XP_024363356.1 uncharacterized protein LOC112276347 isoform X2 [Physcomitrella patens]
MSPLNLMLSFGSLRGGASPVSVSLPHANGSGEGKKSPLPPVLLECGYYDVEQVHYLTQALLVTLAKACVEKTAGDPFSQRAGVLPDIKKEMLEYLHQQSEAYACGSGISSHGMGQVLPPSKVVDDIFESFIKSKKNLFSRVSSKIIDSIKKEDKVDDFVKELDRTGVWVVGRREARAKALLKRVDRSKTYHCEMKFDTDKELEDHRSTCNLRPYNCKNNGCGAFYSAHHAAAHDTSCPHKLLSCKLECGSLIPRGEMEAHVVTVCPMKIVKCPYHAVGCLHAMAQKLLEQHCTEHMGQHLLETLQYVQNHEVAIGSHVHRIVLLEKALQLTQRSEAVDIGTVLLTVKEHENRVKQLEAEVKKLQADLKATDASAEVLQLRRELRNLQKQVEGSTLQSSAYPPQ